MVTIDVLFFDGCPNHEPTVQLAREVVSALGVPAEIHEVAVETAGDAEERRFLGSPTVRVNGSDIEPGADDRTGFTLSCRMYGSAGVPPRDWMVAALEGA